MNPLHKSRIALCTISLLAISIAACSQTPTPVAPTPSAEARELAALKAVIANEQKNLDTFDDLDFNVFSGQKWDELKHSHSEDVIVHWPDGHVTKGIEVHIQDLKNMFTYAPDTRIKVHPVKLGQDNYTAVSGVMEGTFTQPMAIGDGKSIAPTGKAYKIDMATIGRWENGVMKEEWLFWDNQTYTKQLGIGQ